MKITLTTTGPVESTTPPKTTAAPTVLRCTFEPNTDCFLKDVQGSGNCNWTIHSVREKNMDNMVYFDNKFLQNFMNIPMFSPLVPRFFYVLVIIFYREEHRAIIPDRTLLQRDLILLTWKPQGNHRAPKLSWRVRQYKCRVSIPYVELLPGYIKAFSTWISWLTI